MRDCLPVMWFVGISLEISLIFLSLWANSTLSLMRYHHFGYFIHIVWWVDAAEISLRSWKLWLFQISVLRDKNTQRLTVPHIRGCSWMLIIVIGINPQLLMSKLRLMNNNQMDKSENYFVLKDIGSFLLPAGMWSYQLHDALSFTVRVVLASILNLFKLRCSHMIYFSKIVAIVWLNDLFYMLKWCKLEK